MKIDNIEAQATLLDWVADHGSPEHYEMLKLMVSEYERLIDEFDEDRNIDKFAACVNLLQDQLNKLLKSWGKGAPVKATKPPMLFSSNTTMH